MKLNFVYFGEIRFVFFLQKIKTGCLNMTWLAGYMCPDISSHITIYLGN